MTLFVDTSAIIALIDRDDPAHAAVANVFGQAADEVLVTHAYVVVETLAVVRRRFGPSAAAAVMDRIVPGLDVVLVDAELHAAALKAFREGVESSVSLVDRTSFALMHRAGIERAIAIDTDFRTAGFQTAP